MENVRTGSCACGEISFTVSTRPRFVGYCHCNACKKATGAPVSCYVGLARSDVTLVGEPRSFATSEGVARTWCATCGTPVAYESARWPGEIHFHIAMFDHPETLKPTGHVYTNEQLPWFEVADDLPRTDKPSG